MAGFDPVPNQDAGLDPDYLQAYQSLQDQAKRQTAAAAITVGNATGTSPDEVAGYAAIARKYNVPTSVVQQWPKEFKVRAAIDDARENLDSSPVLRNAVTQNQDLASLIHDDMPRTAAMEQSMSQWNPSYGERFHDWFNDILGLRAKGLARSQNTMAAREAGVDAGQARDAVGGMSEAVTQAPSAALNAASFGIIPNMAGDAETTTGKVAGGLGTLAGFLVGPAKAGAAGIEALGIKALEHVPGESFAKALAKDLVTGSLSMGIANTLANTGNEINSPDALTALKSAGSAAGSGALMGAIFGAASRFLPARMFDEPGFWGGGKFAPDASAGSTLAQAAGRAVMINAGLGAANGTSLTDDRPLEDKVFDYGLNTLFALHGAGRVEGGWWHDAAKADIAVEDANRFNVMAQIWSTMKLRERSPEEFRNLAAAMKEEYGTPDPLIDARKFTAALEQSGVSAQELIDKMPEVAKQMREGLQAEGMIRIPVEEYATQIAGGDLDKLLRPDIRFDPKGATLGEAEKFYQNWLPGLKEEAAKIAQQKADDDQWTQSNKQVFDDAKAKFVEAGRTDAEAKQAASLLQAYYAVHAAREAEPTLPHEFAEKYPIDVNSFPHLGGGETMDQGPRSLADVAKHLDDLGVDHSISENDQRISVSKIVVPEGERGQGKGTEAMRAITDYADHTGKQVVLSPSADFGGTKSRLVDFYKRLGFVENKGKGKDFSTMESMRREAAPRQQVDKQGPFGRVFTGLTNNPEGSIDKLMSEKAGEVPDAFVHPELGPIAFVYGNDSFGLRHIEVRRGASFLEKIPEILRTGRVVPDEHGLPRAYVVDEKNPADLAVIRLDWDGAEKTWLVTSYTDTRGKFAEGGKTSDTPALLPHEMPPIEGEGRFPHGPGEDSIASEIDKFKQGPRGQINFGEGMGRSASTISLFKEADYSTVPHELGHYFLELTTHLATQPDAHPDTVRDMDAIKSWFGKNADHMLEVLDKHLAAATDPEQKAKLEAAKAAIAEAGGADFLRKYAESWPKGVDGASAEANGAARVLMHEYFARGTEAYLMEGKAPTLPMQGVFAKFRRWLTEIYRNNPENLDVHMSPEFREVMDRMLATEDAINEAQAVRGMKPLFESKPEGMTDAAWQQYQALGQQGTEAAIESMLARGLRDMQWLSNAKSKVMKELQKQAAGRRSEIRDQVAKEVEKQPIYQAERWLNKGEMTTPEGEEVKATKGFRLNTDDLKTMYPEGKLDNPDLAGLKGMTSKDGLHPDLVAEMFGFGSGDQMVRELASRQPKEAVIKGLTDKRMLEEHGDLTDPQSIERAAEAAIHNEFRAKFISTELNGLAKATGPASMLAKAAAEAADAAIGSKKIGELMPKQYEIQEAKAARAADKAWKKGDTQETAIQKRAQLLNNALAKKAGEAQAEIEKALKYFKRFDKDSIRSKLEPADRDVIDGLLERFDFRKNPTEGPTKKQVQLQQWVDSQKELGYSPPEIPDMVDPNVRMPYRDMTVDQMRSLRDTIESIEHIARERKLITVDGKRVDLKAAVDPMIEKMKERGEKFTDEQIVDPPRLGVDPLWRVALDRFASWIRGAAAELKPMAFKANQFDLHGILGPFHRFIFEPIHDANYRALDMQRELSLSMRDKAEKLGLDKDWQESLNEVVSNHNLMDNSIGGAPKRRLTRGDLIGIAMHVGNESNFDKLVQGMGWEPTDIWSAVHNNMRWKDWQAARLLGEAAGAHWEKMAEMNRRLGNDNPDKIEPRPFQTQFGEMPGWYAPIRYDPVRSKLGKRQADARAVNPQDGLFSRDYYRADTTTNGSLNARTGYKDFIDLDWHRIERSIHETIRDLAYREALIDVHKLYSNNDFRSQMMRTYGPEAYESLGHWLGRLVNAEVGDERQSKFVAISQMARRALVANGIAFRMSTMEKHGFSAGAKTLGYFAGGGEKYFAARALAIGVNHSAEVVEGLAKSRELRARYSQQDRDLKENIASIMEPESLHGKAERFGHAGVAFFDFLTAVPTFHAAYDWATTEGIPERLGGTGKPMSEKDALIWADSIVREAHGTNIESGRSMLMTNPSEWVKNLTILHGFMNNAGGQVADTYDKAMHANGFGKPELAARFFMAQLVPAVIAATVTYGGVKTGESVLGWLGKSIFGEFSGMLPMVREAYSAVVEGHDSAGLPPWLRAITDFYKGAKTAEEEAQGKDKKHPIKDVGNAAGLFLPGLGQAGATTQFLYDVATGKQHPQTVADWLRGIQSGNSEAPK